MSKKQKSFIVQIQAEGQKLQRDMEKEELKKEAKKLAVDMPTFGPDRLIYVRNLTMKALKGQVDIEVFKQFINMTNSWMELETCLPRAEQLVRKKR